MAVSRFNQSKTILCYWNSHLHSLRPETAGSSDA